MALENLQYFILKRFFPLPEEERLGAAVGPREFSGRTKLERLLGTELIASLKDKVIVDFGCGDGQESIALAQAGARNVIGLDIRDHILQEARQNAIRAGVAHCCRFGKTTDVRADVVVSIDAFEHFAEPLAMLLAMERLLAPGGTVIVSFGPTWYHPRGGHLFSVFPWAHLLLSEKALIRWRAAYRSDGATKFGEVEGGLNQITVHRFEELVARSPFRLAEFEAVPIAKLRPIHNRLTREFTSAIVRCRLVRKADAVVDAPTSQVGTASASV